MDFTRRHLLTAAGALVLPRLAVAQTAADDFIGVRAAPVSLGLPDADGLSTAAWALGAGPGPQVIRARQGLELRLRFSNALDRDVELRFFGVRGPAERMTVRLAANDGAPVDCVFTPPDAGTFWIGPATDVSRARDMGLYAVLVVEEEMQPVALADQVLVLDDWKLSDDGVIDGAFGDVEAMVGEGRLGNWFTVNGRFRPRLALAGDRFTRLRLLNVANVRTMAVLFKGYDPLLIARDGQPSRPAPLAHGALFLAPGQRADLLVSPEEGDIGLALDLFEDVVEIAYLVADGASSPAPVSENFALPANPLPALPAPEGGRTVPLVIEGGIKGGLRSARLDGVERDLRQLLENGKGWAVNGIAGPADEPLFRAVAGELIVLEVENRTAFSQPLHLQGHAWQDVSGEPTGQWLDSHVVPARGRARLAFLAGNPGRWAVHSLVAERVDGGLTGAFEIAPAPG